MRHLLARPQVTRKVIAQYQVLVVGVAKEVAFRDRFVFVVEEFECVLVRELYHWVLQAANLLEHLISDLRI